MDGSANNGASRHGSVARIAEGAEETRLVEADDGDEEEDVYGRSDLELIELNSVKVYRHH